MKLNRILCALIPVAMLLTLPVIGTADSDISETDRNKILETFPELSAGSISASPIRGLYQVMLGGQVSYISADGRYLVRGDIFDVVEERNLTEVYRETARQTAIDEIGAGNMIVFRPEEVKHTITVFTDIDCGYCRKLHRQIEGYNDLGIEVRYLFFPRSGPATSSWYKAENVWCAEDQNAALTKAKAGEEINSSECGGTPVNEHYQLGLSIGIRGTPAIVVQGGELIPGYVSPDELLNYFEE